MGVLVSWARYLAVAGGVLVGGLGTSPVASAATYETSVSRATISWPGDADFDGRLRITTGSQAERLKVTANPPGFYETSLGTHGALEHLSAMRLEGPGTVVDRARGTIYEGAGVCTDESLRVTHGFNHNNPEAVTVEIPANSTATIVAPLRPTQNSYPGPHAPWLGTRLGATFSVSARNSDGTWTPAQSVVSPSPTNTGKHGVRISLQSDPPSSRGQCHPAYFFYYPPAGTEVEFGKQSDSPEEADPEVAGQLMTIRTPDADLADVPIAADGSFTYFWHPSHLATTSSGRCIDRNRRSSSTTTPTAPPVHRRPATSHRETPPRIAPADNRTGTLHRRPAPLGCRRAMPDRSVPHVPASRRQGSSDARRGSTYRVAVRGRYRKRPAAARCA